MGWSMGFLKHYTTYIHIIIYIYTLYNMWYILFMSGLLNPLKSSCLLGSIRKKNISDDWITNVGWLNQHVWWFQPECLMTKPAFLMISTTMFHLVLIFVAGETAIFDVAIDPARCWLSQRLWHPLLQRGGCFFKDGERRNMENSCGSIMFNPALWFNPAFLPELTWFSHQKVKI